MSELTPTCQGIRKHFDEGDSLGFYSPTSDFVALDMTKLRVLGLSETVEAVIHEYIHALGHDEEGTLKIINDVFEANQKLLKAYEEKLDGDRFGITQETTRTEKDNQPLQAR